MYTTVRHWYKYGREGDEIEITWKEHTTIEKALNYVYRYSVGLKFISCVIEDKDGNLIYELDYSGNITDNRTNTPA